VSKEQDLRHSLAEMKIAQLISAYPQTRPVLFSHFGASCFDCPASTEETTDLGVRVHSADAESFYNELMERISISSGTPNPREQESVDTCGTVEKVD